MRPRSLYDISVAASQDASPSDLYPSLMKEYLDEVVNMTAGEVLASIEAEPQAISPVLDAHIAGMAEFLAFHLDAGAPAWASGPSRFLKEPVFFGGRHARPYMLTSTTWSMRRRNLFCGEVSVQNVLDGEIAAARRVIECELRAADQGERLAP